MRERERERERKNRREEGGCAPRGRFANFLGEEKLDYEI